MTTKKYAALIPARGGSKRLPGKNLKLLNGEPLLSYSLKGAQQNPQINWIFVSTDSADIHRFALSFGIKDLGLRPPYLAEDLTSSLDVIRFEWNRMEAQVGFIDYVVLLQPTSPLRTAKDISEAIALFEKSRAETLTSVVKTENPKSDFWITKDAFIVELKADQSDVVPQQKFQENGAIYILSRKNILDGKFYGSTVVGFEMPLERSVDIDTAEDFAQAEKLLKSEI